MFFDASGSVNIDKNIFLHLTISNLCLTEEYELALVNNSALRLNPIKEYQHTCNINVDTVAHIYPSIHHCIFRMVHK